MPSPEEDKVKELLEETLWQVEEAKRIDLPILKAMNFINLSREAQGYGNVRLASGLLDKARESLFKDMLDHYAGSFQEGQDVVLRLRKERTLKEAKELFGKGNVKEAYDLLLNRVQLTNERVECVSKPREEATPQQYSEALDTLQKVWLRMKQEESKGKEMKKAQILIKEAKAALAGCEYPRVISICQEITGVILSPQDRLREEVEETIEEMGRTMKALFPGDARSPKERLFRKQIEDLMNSARDNMERERPLDAINASRKAKEILLRLEQESIKGELPRMTMELKGAIDELRAKDVDISYEEYLLRQIEDTFWKGEYIKAMKLANKLDSTIKNAKAHLRMNELNNRLNDLNLVLKDRAGREGYPEARDCLLKAKALLDQSSYDMACSFMDRARELLEA